MLSPPRAIGQLIPHYQPKPNGPGCSGPAHAEAQVPVANLGMPVCIGDQVPSLMIAKSLNSEGWLALPSSALGELKGSLTA